MPLKIKIHLLYILEKKINKKSIKKTLQLLEMKNIQKKKKIGIKR